MNQGLGKFFQSLRSKGQVFLWLLIAALIGLVGLNVAVHPHHPHVAAEVYPGFWAVFALAAAVAMAMVMKGLITELLAVPEDVYRPKPAAKTEENGGEAHP